MRIQVKEFFSFKEKNKKTKDVILKRFLTSAQVVEMICKPDSWVERRRTEGGGPAFRYIGKTPVYEEQDVINWIEEIPKITCTYQLHDYF